MTFQRIGSGALVALSYALVLLSRSTSSDASPIYDCFGLFRGDGECDLIYNIEECDYDGGDCCECTCVSTDDYTCGENGGYACIDPSAQCVDDDDVTTGVDLNESCIHGYFKDGFCDQVNNVEECGYDGGDCCECTCVSTDRYTCGEEFNDNNGGFVCMDPDAPCFDDGDDDYLLGSYSYGLWSMDYDPACYGRLIGDGDCHQRYNNEECGYDGGDCCECTCSQSLNQYGCDLRFDPLDCIDPRAPCFNGYVEAGTKTVVGVSANAYDTRPGQDSNMVGCGGEGCAPALTRDGITDEIESSWRCAQTLVPGGGFCEIEFTFENPQNVVEVQLAFPYEVNTYRQLEVVVNGEDTYYFGSYLQEGNTFTRSSLTASDVHTITFQHTDSDEHEWINLLEVRFMVEP